MVRLFSLIALITALASPALASDRSEINALLDEFNASAARSDGATYFGSFTPNAVFVGTDATERWTLDEFRAFAQPYFDQGKGWTYLPGERTITFADVECGCVAWFEEALTSPSYGTTRGTGMVVKGEDGWKIGQYVLTIPIPNEIAKDVVAIIRRGELAGERARSRSN